MTTTVPTSTITPGDPLEPYEGDGDGRGSRPRTPFQPFWWIGNAFVWLGGGNWRDIGDRQERSAFVVSGFFVLLNAFIAWAVATLAAVGLAAVPLSDVAAYTVVWGLFVGAFDRTIASYVPAVARRRGRPSGGIVARAVMAVVLGVIIGELASLFIFGNAIERQLLDNISQARTASTQLAQETVQQEINRLIGERDLLDQDIAGKEGLTNTAYQAYLCEVNGRPAECPPGITSTTVPGRGKEAAAREAEWLAQRSALEDARARRTGLRPPDGPGQPERTLDQMIQQRQRELEEVGTEVAVVTEKDRGIDARWRAMHDYTTSSTSAFLLRLLVAVLLAAVDLVPLIVKLLRGETDHDRRVRARRDRKRVLLDAHTILRHASAKEIEAGAARAGQVRAEVGELVARTTVKIERENQNHRFVTARRKIWANEDDADSGVGEQTDEAGGEHLDEDGAAGSPPSAPAGYGAPIAVHRITGSPVAVGRDSSNHLILDDLLVSPRHARLERTVDGWVVIDLDTFNGTYVNGRRVAGSHPFGSDDIIGIGHYVLQLVSNGVDEYISAYGDTGEVTLEAMDLRVPGRLEDISFSLPARSLTAVIGPTGSGKSTLLGALTGMRPATEGTVCYAGRNLYENYDELRHRVGLVPQEDILHSQLAIGRALHYGALLRFPSDASASARRDRVAEVVDDLGLTSVVHRRISAASGGEQKRTSVALELLTKPSLLFLDEPTSSLDDGLKKSVMAMLARLSRAGQTVVVVTHDTHYLDLCDRLMVLAPGGRLAYFGPPKDALTYFGKPAYSDVLDALRDEPGTDWAGRYERSDVYRQNMAAQAARRPSAQPSRSVPTPPARQQSALTQFAVLCRRQLALISTDRQYSISLVALPVLLSVLALAVPGAGGLSASAQGQPPQAGQLLLVLVLGALLMGSAGSVRELIKERPIYRRERAVGLSAGAYLLSKLVVLGVLAAAQGAMFALVVLVFRAPPDNALVLASARVEIVVAVAAVALVAMVLGLAISAVIRTADQGMPALVLLIMAQLILCGGLFPVEDRAVLEQLAWLTPGRWGFAMGAATTDLGSVAPAAPDPDQLWAHSAGTWFGDLGALLVIGTALVLLVAWLLRRLEPRRESRPR